MKAVFKWFSCWAFIMLCSQVMAYTIEERISELESQMQEVGTTNPQGTFGAGFTSANSETIHNLCIVVEPLYWHAKAGGTEYAYTDKSINPALSSLLPNINGRLKEQSFGWEWGLRLGVGHIFEHDNWDVYLNYTWYEADDSTSVHKNLPSKVVPTRAGFFGPMQRAKSHFDLNYNNINLELGRHYFMSSKVSIRPQIGLKSSWIFDRQNIQYNLNLQETITVYVGNRIIDIELNPNRDIKVRDKSVLWGMGPRAGVEAEWSIGDGFSLYAKMAGALLYGYFRSSFHLNANSILAELGEDIQVRLSGNNHLFVPNAQMMLGLIWETYINKNRQHITLGAGYEVEYFWRANQTFETDDTNPSLLAFDSLRFDVYRTSEDIMFYGITLKMRLDF